MFQFLDQSCRPIASPSRRYSSDGRAFIDEEVRKLLVDGIIERFETLCRAQVVVTKDSGHIKRLVIDYSQTINKFTLLYAYPLPRRLAQHVIFLTFDQTV